jgi:hypothetical protein
MEIGTLHITGLYTLRRLGAARPRSVAVAPSLFGLHPALRRAWTGREETFIQSASQGHMPSAHWRSLQARRIQPER